MSQTIAFILPLYGHHEYGRHAALTFFAHSPPDAQVLAYEDAHPSASRTDWVKWSRGFPPGRHRLRVFPSNAGLTRSWNEGLADARRLGFAYALCGNSDLAFTPGWSDALIHALESGRASLAGPVTNAPGPTNQGAQGVERWLPKDCRPALDQAPDDPEWLGRAAAALRRRHGWEFQEMGINGFCMLAKTATWWSGAFDAQRVFDPSKRMTGNEDELQKRWRRLGRRAGFCPGSFVFHYRSVTRGPRFRREGWHRASFEGGP
jgi:GT2 family glycosyltransferase